MSHISQHLLFFQGVIAHHDLVSLSLSLDDFLDSGGSGLSLIDRLVTIAIGSFQSAVHSQLRNQNIRLELNLVTLALFFRFKDVLTLNFSVLNLLFVLIWKGQGSELEEDDFMPGLLKHVHLEVLKHLLLDGRSLQEEVV